MLYLTITLDALLAKRARKVMLILIVCIKFVKPKKQFPDVTNQLTKKYPFV